jgi:hypothetical protein
MKKSNASQNLTSSDSVWYLFAESSLIEFMSEIDRGDELKAGRLFQERQKLDIPPSSVEKIERTLKEFVREALVHYKQSKLELTGRIRVFCQIKLIDAANSAHTSELCQTEQNMEQVQMIHHPCTRMDGGWGYFLIERGGDFQPGSSVSTGNWIDLYLYKEGE